MIAFLVASRVGYRLAGRLRVRGRVGVRCRAEAHSWGRLCKYEA